jgi:hypothetical protein
MNWAAPESKPISISLFTPNCVLIRPYSLAPYYG